jgi:hypothetical protein
VNITNQFLEIDILLANDGFVPVLKKLPVAIISEVKIYGLPG